MSFFDGDYIRIKTPDTTDGVNIKIVNDKVVYKEQYMPFNKMSMKALEEENARRPDHLKHKIEVVHS